MDVKGLEVIRRREAEDLSKERQLRLERAPNRAGAAEAMALAFERAMGRKR